MSLLLCLAIVFVGVIDAVRNVSGADFHSLERLMTERDRAARLSLPGSVFSHTSEDPLDYSDPLKYWVEPVFRNQNIRFLGVESNGSRWKFLASSNNLTQIENYEWMHKLQNMDNVNLNPIGPFDVEIVAEPEVMRSLFRDVESDKIKDSDDPSMSLSEVVSLYENDEMNQRRDILLHSVAAAARHNRMRQQSRGSYLLMSIVFVFVFLLSASPFIFVCVRY